MGAVARLGLAAIECAAPLLAALFLADVALGLLSRAAPEMHVFVLGLPVKLLLTLTLTGLALPLLPGAVSTLTDRIVHDGLTVVGLGCWLRARESVGKGRRVYVCVSLGGRRICKQKKTTDST